MKKLICLLLSVLLLMSLAACGEGEPVENTDGSTPSGTTQPTDPTNPSNPSNSDDPTDPEPEDETVWVLAKEHSMGSKRYTKYFYDEQGNLLSGEFYNGSDKMGDYQYVTTENADGGKTVEVRYKSVNDSEYITDGIMKFNAQGKIVHYQEYDINGNIRDYSYTFTYNDAGKLIQQVGTGSDSGDKKLIVTYEGDRLTGTHYTESDGDFAKFSYSYDADGNPASVQMEYDSLDYQNSMSFDFVIREFEDEWKLCSEKDAPKPMDNRDLFVVTKNCDSDGNLHSVKIDAKPWGVFCNSWVPTAELGCLDVDNFFYGTAQLVYMPLDVYLAEQGAQ